MLDRLIQTRGRFIVHCLDTQRKEYGWEFRTTPTPPVSDCWRYTLTTDGENGHPQGWNFECQTTGEVVSFSHGMPYDHLLAAHIGLSMMDVVKAHKAKNMERLVDLNMNSDVEEQHERN
ncbi:MAG: hypothetical protein Tp1124DCM412911_36 [Prokaryotic dsDNA virus sp.]|nr:MAG: hypothetical protein Tp1124DCM412911_36 [Prokaryotic dsDNA virus sp.]